MFATVVILTIIQTIQEPTFLSVTSKLDEMFASIKKPDKVEIDPPFWTNILTAVIIIIFSKMYMNICTYLTNNENHQKQSDYNRSYVIKKIIFNIVCNYYSLYYIIYFKAYKGKCPKDDCISNLSSQLNSIFIANYIALIIEIGIPIIKWLITNYMLRKSIKKVLLSRSNEHNDCEKANAPIKPQTNNELSEEHCENIFYFVKKEYNYLFSPKYNSIVDEYEQIIILFGFICQFIIVNPYLVFLFFLYVYIQV